MWGVFVFLLVPSIFFFWFIFFLVPPVHGINLSRDSSIKVSGNPVDPTSSRILFAVTGVRRAVVSRFSREGGSRNVSVPVAPRVSISWCRE